jgi:hypothetical protein
LNLLVREGRRAGALVRAGAQKPSTNSMAAIEPAGAELVGRFTAARSGASVASARKVGAA